MSDRAFRVPDYLAHMHDATAKIIRYTSKMSAREFIEDERTQDAVIRCIEVLGEAARNIQRVDPAFTQQHTTINWRGIYGMRNVLAHEYFNIDLETIWELIQRDIPVLYQQIQQIINTM